MNTVLIVLLIVIFGGGFLFLFFRSVSVKDSSTNKIKQIIDFLGFDFKDNYTIIEFKNNGAPILGDVVMSISIPDESFEEIEMFLRSINLGKEEIKFSEDKETKYIEVWHKNKDTDIFTKTYSVFNKEGCNFFIATLDVDCDKKIISFLECTY